MNWGSGVLAKGRLSRLQRDILLALTSISVLSPTRLGYNPSAFRMVELDSSPVLAVPRFLFSLVPANRARLEASRIETIQATTSRSLRTLAKKGCVTLLNRNLEPLGHGETKVKYVALSKTGALLTARMLAGMGFGEGFLGYCRGLLLFRGKRPEDFGLASRTVAGWIADGLGEELTHSQTSAITFRRGSMSVAEDPLFSFLASLLPR